MDWNDTIARMNKKDSLKRLMNKMLPLWAKEGKVKACLMYSACSTAGFSDFKTLAELEHYIDTIIIDMLYIKTSYGEYQIYLDKYDTYRFENRKDYTLLKMIMYDREIDIKL